MTARRYAWALVILLWVVAVLNYTDRQVVFSIFPLLTRDLNLPSSQLGLLSTVFLWIYGALSPISGFIADRFGRTRSITFSLAVWSAVTLLTGFSTNFVQMLSARALMGISEACYLPAALAKIAQHHGPKTRSLATGLHQSGLYVGLVLGGTGGGWAAEHYGWRRPFLILGAAGLAYFAVLFQFFRRADRTATSDVASEPQPQPFWASLRELTRIPGFSIMTTVFTTVAIANWLVYTWLPLYLYEHFRMSLSGAGFTATFYIQAASIAGIIFGGWLADRWALRSERGRVYTQIVGVTVSSPFLFMLGYTNSYGLLLLALILFGAGRGFYDCNTMPVLCQAAPDHLRSTGYGIFNFAGCVAGGLMAGLAGILKSTLGLGAAFQLAAIVLFLSGALLLRVHPADPH